MAAKSTGDKFSYGITFLTFGVIYLLNKVGFLEKIPHATSLLLSIGGLFLVAGVIFIITQPRKFLSWIFLVIGVFLNAEFFFGRLTEYSGYIVPVSLIIIGLIMILTRKK